MYAIVMIVRWQNRASPSRPLFAGIDAVRKKQRIHIGKFSKPLCDGHFPLPNSAAKGLSFIEPTVACMLYPNSANSSFWLHRVGRGIEPIGLWLARLELDLAWAEAPVISARISGKIIGISANYNTW